MGSWYVTVVLAVGGPMLVLGAFLGVMLGLHPLLVFVLALIGFGVGGGLCNLFVLMADDAIASHQKMLTERSSGTACASGYEGLGLSDQQKELWRRLERRTGSGL